MAKVMDRLTEIFNKTGQPVSVIIKGNSECAYIGVDMKNHSQEEVLKSLIIAATEITKEMK